MVSSDGVHAATHTAITVYGMATCDGESSAMAAWRARKRTRDALPKQITKRSSAATNWRSGPVPAGHSERHARRQA
jgi:hypothetical protein